MMNAEKGSELIMIRSNAWSIRPGEAAPGQYIGSEFIDGIEYQYFQDQEGAYWYRIRPEYDPRKK